MLSFKKVKKWLNYNFFLKMLTEVLSGKLTKMT